MSNNEINYGVAALNALMGTRGDISRISLLGKPALNSNLASPDKARTLAEGDDASCDVDFGLQFIELRADGLYVNGEVSSGLLQEEFSAITGDWELTRRTGVPLLPIPFTARELQAVEAALGIVERLQAGEDTDIEISRLRRKNAEAGDLAEWLIRGKQANVEHPITNAKVEMSASPAFAVTHDSVSAEVKSETALPAARRTWWEATSSYVAGVQRSAQHSTVKKLYNQLMANAENADSPFDKGQDTNRGSLVWREKDIPVSLKTMQNKKTEIFSLAKIGRTKLGVSLPSVPQGTRESPRE